VKLLVPTDTVTVAELPPAVIDAVPPVIDQKLAGLPVVVNCIPVSPEQRMSVPETALMAPGVAGMGLGCAGFAFFSLAIEHFLDL